MQKPWNLWRFDISSMGALHEHLSPVGRTISSIVGRVHTASAFVAVAVVAAAARPDTSFSSLMESS